MEVLLIGALLLVLLAAEPTSAKPREIHSEPRLIEISHNPPPPPKPTPPIADEPTSIIAAGGAPLEEGWRTVGWYSYLGRQFWIRVDQHDEGAGPGASMILPMISDRWKVDGWLYRWTVIAGNATPLATEDVEEDFTLEGPAAGMNPEFAYKLVMAEVYRFIAREASDWIDDNIAVGGKKPPPPPPPPTGGTIGESIVHIESRPRPKLGVRG